MTVAVSLNLSDGVILAVDSAVTVPDNSDGTIAKVYENANKLFQLGHCPIGVAIYGMGAIGSRGIGSYLREFELTDPIMDAPAPVPEVVESLREFFYGKYRDVVIPAIELATGEQFANIPDDDKPVLGLIVGGFSPNAYLSEVWEIVVPFHHDPDSATSINAQGEFGSHWFSMYEPIRRYTKGLDAGLLSELVDYFIQLRGGAPLTPAESDEVKAILVRYEYAVPFAAMPMVEGVEHARFLVELVTKHHRFTVGAPVVGGTVNIGMVTYRGDEFRILGSSPLTNLE